MQTVGDGTDALEIRTRLFRSLVVGVGDGMAKKQTFLTDGTRSGHGGHAPTTAPKVMQADFERGILGRRGEDLAVEFLKERGWRVVARNVRYSVGEIDIIAEQKNRLFFLEVKTRGEDSLVPAREALSPKQLKRLRRAAEWYLLEREGKHGGNVIADLGLIAIDLDGNGHVQNMELIDAGN